MLSNDSKRLAFLKFYLSKIQRFEQQRVVLCPNLFWGRIIKIILLKRGDSFFGQLLG